MLEINKQADKEKLQIKQQFAKLSTELATVKQQIIDSDKSADIAELQLQREVLETRIQNLADRKPLKGDTGQPGKSIEVRQRNGIIEWSVVGEDSWTTLLDTTELNGVDGESPMTVSDTPPKDPEIGDLWYKP